jgi:cytochrome c5
MTRIRSVPTVHGTPPAMVLALALALAHATAGPAAAAQTLSGAEVYTQVCTACHEAGVAGAPKRGDTKAWKPLIAEGQRSLSLTAIKGIRGMPAKGGRPDLSDLEVRRAVAYLANAGGAKWSEPAN